MQIRQVTAEVKPFWRHDGGCRVEGVSILGGMIGQFRHAMLVFDFDGSGVGVTSAIELEQQLEDELRKVGWSDNAAAIVVEPEIEAWVWANSPNVARVLGWADDPSLRDWLRLQGILNSGEPKPVARLF